jgi:DNA helicase-2/ATP-dependent DNA helicase PcrA
MTESPVQFTPPSRAVAGYLEALNPAQREAVETLEGPLLVLAGAGTGKTRVLTTRLAHIVGTRRAWPNQILAVTFTNKAAREMRDRVAGLIAQDVEGLWIGTFHALAARILRRHAELVGLQPNFTILDQDDQIRLLRQILEAANVDETRWPARALHAVIERFKDRGLTPDKVDRHQAGDVAGGRAIDFYREYQDRLRALNACDFGDLLLHGLTLFTTREDVLESYQQRFKYLLVDEYQDTNVAQYLWLRLLAQRHHNICCVGDDDQSIYSWRGAEVGNILRFEKDFPGARVVRLEQNYRSTSGILAAASGLIARNQGRLGKTLWTERSGGDRVIVRGVWDGDAEARYVGEEIEALQRAGTPLGEIAVLVRTSAQMRAFEERFVTLGLPYRVVGGPRFYERQESRDAIAYLRLIHQPADDLAFERIVNVPRRGIGEATLQTLHRLARAQSVPLTEAARRVVETDEVKPQARKALRGLIADLDRWRSQAPVLEPGPLAEIVLDESGYTAMWKNDKSPEAPGRLENLKELVAALEEFDALEAFLEHVGLVMDRDVAAAGEAANLMTLHAAKGLEFAHVFLPGWEEDLFPNRRALDEGGTAALEEERRLAYVGMTRAKQRVVVSFTASRRLHNQWLQSVPSRFIDELPPGEVEVDVEAGLYRGRTEAGGGLSDAAFAPYAERVGRGPGYERLRSATRRAPPDVIAGRARAVAVSMPGDGPGAISVGTRVFHQKFGYGTVTAADGNKLEIDFEKAGTKKVFDNFVEAV